MVTIVDVIKRKNKTTDKEFNVMMLQGDAEIVMSKTTGKPYLTARKTSIPCTFGEEQAKMFVGQSLPGTIER